MSTDSLMLTDSLTTALTIGIIAVMALWRSRKADDNFFFTKDYTTTLKGLCAIVVIFIHFPEWAENPVQRGVGMFAYVAVTIFFMISAYGMAHSTAADPRYLSRFWRGRLAALIVPNLLLNLIWAGWLAATGAPVVAKAIYTLNPYVIILLEYCAWFYAIGILDRITKGRFNNAKDWILISGIAASSVWLYLGKDGEQVSAELGWCYERWGLILGILLYRYFDRVKEWLATGEKKKAAVIGVIAAVAGVAYLKYKHIWLAGEFALKIALGVAIIAFMFAITRRIRIDNPFTRWLGGISYEIYLCHGMVMGALATLCPGLDGGMFIICTVVGTLALALVARMADAPLVSVLRGASAWRAKARTE